jgi:transcription-repair coupling factor (superfamily II helicase)
LEDRIVAFTMGDIDVLVATTIMENGIDIPNVNTIVIQHTHMFGLAQLHQLRGRVGRAAAQAYAMMMHPPKNQLSEDAMSRLRVIQRESALGSGQSLAQADLEMRGAGNLFGEAQKGSGMAEIGLDMYVEVLQKAMSYLQKKQELGLPDDPDMEVELLRSAMGDDLLVGIDDSLAVK